MTGEELRKRRQSEKLTQSTMGEKLGVAANTIARWERDELPIPHWVPLLLARDHTRRIVRLTAETDAASLIALYERLRKEIPARRKEVEVKSHGAWVPDAIPKMGLIRILNWIEGELDTIIKPKPKR